MSRIQSIATADQFIQRLLTLWVSSVIDPKLYAVGGEKGQGQSRAGMKIRKEVVKRSNGEKNEQISLKKERV